MKDVSALARAAAVDDALLQQVENIDIILCLLVDTIK